MEPNNADLNHWDQPGVHVLGFPAFCSKYLISYSLFSDYKTLKKDLTIINAQKKILCLQATRRVMDLQAKTLLHIFLLQWVPKDWMTKSSVL